MCVPYQLLQPVGKPAARRGQAWAMDTVLGAKQNIQAKLEELPQELRAARRSVKPRQFDVIMADYTTRLHVYGCCSKRRNPSSTMSAHVCVP